NVDKPNARFVPAGPDHAQIAAINGVMDYLEALHDHHAGPEDRDRRAFVHDLMRAAEQANLEPLLAFLRDRPGVRVVGPDTVEHRAPTVAIRVQGRSPAEIAAALAERRIGIGNGNCYAWRLMEALGIPPEEGVARLSFVHYTAPEEIRRLIEALDEIL
ncbi:MAG: aminotransferase class V-fold PLP-dependent enzyme, partial [Gammaproteobacteria bacterium]